MANERRTTALSPKRKREQLAAEILHAVPEPRLVAAVGFVLRERYLREHPEETATSDRGLELEVNVREFMKTCSLRQLRLLLEIALGLDESVERLH
jgi:hypothetical protein